MQAGILIASLICFVVAVAVGVVVVVALSETDNNLADGSTTHLPSRQFRSQLDSQQQESTGRRKSRRHFHYHA